MGGPGSGRRKGSKKKKSNYVSKEDDAIKKTAEWKAFHKANPKMFFLTYKTMKENAAKVYNNH